jgi:hypothetical protein
MLIIVLPAQIMDTAMFMLRVDYGLKKKKTLQIQ